MKTTTPKPAKPVTSANARNRLIAAKIVRDKYAGKYFLMTCGHYGDIETELVYQREARPRGKHWCETCDRWQRLMPKPRRTPIPETPLF